MYTPEFQSGIAIVDISGKVVSPVNPQYCLTLQSAIALAQLPELTPLISAISLADPLGHGDPTSYYHCSALVPFFLYVNGGSENAGFVAQMFMHGWTQAQATEKAQQEIMGTMQAFGTGQIPPVAYATIVVQPIPPAPEAPPPPPPAPPAAPKSPIGLPLYDGRYQDLSGKSLPIGCVATGPDGKPYVKVVAGTSIAGPVYAWTPVV